MTAYSIQSGDTLSTISKKFYNDVTLYQKIAEYNNIKNINNIQTGQIIIIPEISEFNLTPSINVKSKNISNSHNLITPNGLNEIIDTFGNLYNYINSSGDLNPKWNLDKLKTIEIPILMPLAWDTTRKINKITCHKLLEPVFISLFSEIKELQIEDKISGYGGCFNFRAKRRNNTFSTHSWGIAIDLNPLTNAMGTSGDISPDIVNVFVKHGFKWGGDWKGGSCDPMHFQFCTGY